MKNVLIKQLKAACLGTFTILITLSVWAEVRFESVVKDAEFRASLDLPADAAYAELNQGFTYFRTNKMNDCDDRKYNKENKENQYFLNKLNEDY